MKYRKLGKTNLEVSVIALGCWAIVGDPIWGPQSKSDAISTIKTALDLGINFFDTAEGYGNGYSEELLSAGLAEQRHEVVIASKVSSSHLAKNEVIAACERSLKRLKRDYIDLYQIHWPKRTIPLEETMEALQILQQQGKIKYIGVSNFGTKDLSKIMTIGRVEANQIPYSLLWRAVEYEIAPQCVENDISLLPYSPLSQGLLTGKFKTADEVPAGRARTRIFASSRPHAQHGEPGCESETFDSIEKIRQLAAEIQMGGTPLPMAALSLAWLIHQPGVTSVLAGARHPKQITENALATDLEIETEVLQKLSQATENVKSILGKNPDMWQANSRYQ